PPWTIGHALSYDVGRQLTTCFGGVTATLFPPVLSAETWEYDGIDWHQASPVHSPSPRHMHRMTYDPARRRTVLFGGNSIMFVISLLTDTWEFDGHDWSQVVTTTSPYVTPRSLLYDSARDRVVMLGDTFGTTSLWEYDGLDWTQLLAVRLPQGAIGLQL